MFQYGGGGGGGAEYRDIKPGKTDVKDRYRKARKRWRAGEVWGGKKGEGGREGRGEWGGGGEGGNTRPVTARPLTTSWFPGQIDRCRLRQLSDLVRSVLNSLR